MYNNKTLKGYKKVKASERQGILNGITFNDSYNMNKFGINRGDFLNIDAKMKEYYGIISPCLSELTFKKIKKIMEVN